MSEVTCPHNTPQTTPEDSSSDSDINDSSRYEEELLVFENREKVVDNFLLQIPEHDFVTSVKVYSLFFNGKFEYYSDALGMLYGDKLSVRDLFKENIFNACFGKGVIRLTNFSTVFLMQPYVWNVIETKKQYLSSAFQEIYFRLQNQTEKLDDKEVLFRLGIPLTSNYIFTLDYIFDSKLRDEGKNDFLVKMYYRHKYKDFSYFDYSYYTIVLNACSFIDFLGQGNFIGTVMTNACMAEDIPAPSALSSTQMFGNSVMDSFSSEKYDDTGSVKKEFIVRRIY